MESQVNDIRQSIETPRFADQGYNSGNDLFVCPAGVSRQVWPWETTTQRTQRICAWGPGQNSIYEDASWIRRAR